MQNKYNCYHMFPLGTWHASRTFLCIIIQLCLCNRTILIIIKQEYVSSQIHAVCYTVSEKKNMIVKYETLQDVDMFQVIEDIRGYFRMKCGGGTWRFYRSFCG